MAHITYNKLGKSDFDNIVPKKDKVQDIKNNQLKLEVFDIYEKDEKTTTNFEAVNDEDVSNKSILDESLSKIEALFSKTETEDNELKLVRRRSPISKTCQNDYTDTLR